MMQKKHMMRQIRLINFLAQGILKTETSDSRKSWFNVGNECLANGIVPFIITEEQKSFVTDN